MIITRTPLRVSWVGGGSDLPSYYERFGPGMCVGSAIDKYVYVTLHVPFEDHVMVHYRKTERVQRVDALLHDRIRECLISHGIDHQIEVSSLAEVAGNSGLGSSSAFTVGLLHAIHQQVWKVGEDRSWKWQHSLAHEACRIEQIACGDPIGDQDQFLTSLGGTNLLTFYKGGVEVQPIGHSKDIWNHVLLVSLGIGERPNAGSTLSGLVSKSNAGIIKDMIGLVRPFTDAMIGEHWSLCGEILDEAWKKKRELSGVSIPHIDEVYEWIRERGVWGTKVCGAGSGGFMLVLGPEESLEGIEKEWKFPTMRVRGDLNGTEEIYNSKEHL